METQIDNNRNYTDKLISFIKEKKKIFNHNNSFINRHFCLY